MTALKLPFLVSAWTKYAAFEVLEQWNKDSYTQNLLCLNSCTAIAGLLEHSTASMRTTITKVLTLITGGAIINYVHKSIIMRQEEIWFKLLDIHFLGCLTICLQNKMGGCMDKERHCNSQAFSSALTRHKINANLEIIHWLNKNLHMIQMCRKHELKKPEKKCKLNQN